ncbi:MAG: ABC transporter substrate-binding protein [Alphaproteobacteria bacterium]|nr:ABC transporter substrate-binding protein [Alphaproteobacteria bacterium]MCD8566783.1 ABC transporter substrate-binding protein [Alphaproteobacteria bacterium]
MSSFRFKTLSLMACAGILAGASGISFPSEAASLGNMGSVFSADIGSMAIPALMKANNGAQDLEGSKTFVNGMAKRAINFLADQSLPQEKKSQEFKKLLSDSFDLQTIGRFALGRYWKAATPAQQKEYQGLFEKMVVQVYSDRFKDYKGQNLVVDSAKPEGAKDVLVTSFIVPDSGEKVQVDWRVRNKDGRYKIVDIVVEGVSMAVTQRSEFASIIQSGGGNISVLIDHLKK